MAIKNYKNNTSVVDFRGQRVTSEELSFFGGGLENVEFTADGKNVVVTKVYDGTNNLLNVKFEKAAPPTDPATGEFYIRPDLEVQELGYQSGTYRVEYNFWKLLVGDDQLPGVFAKDISLSRTEARLLPNNTQNDTANATIKKDFFDFSNLVMDSADFNVLLDDIFNDIDTAVTINKLDIEFLDRLYNDFQLDDTSFADVLSNILRISRENMLLRLLERGFVAYGEFIRLFDTTMKEAIILYFDDSEYHRLKNPTESINSDVVDTSQIQTPTEGTAVGESYSTTPTNIDNIATEQRKKEKRYLKEKERLKKKNSRMSI